MRPTEIFATSSFLAFCAGASLNAVEAKNSDYRRSALEHADCLANVLEVDMNNWFEPNEDNYFNRISRSQIEEDVQGALGELPLEVKAAKRKLDAAKAATKAVATSKWLPESVTISTPPTEEQQTNVVQYFAEAAE